MYMKALPQVGKETSSPGDQISNAAALGFGGERLLYIRTLWLGTHEFPILRFVKSRYIVF